MTLRELLRPLPDVVGEPGRHVEADAAGPEVVHVQARAADPLAELHQDFALLEAPQHRRHRADVHGEGADGEDVVEDAADLGVQHADVLAAQRRLDAQQLLDGQREGVLLVLRRHVVEPVEVGHRLQIGLVLDQLLGAAMQQADVRIGALDGLAVHLQHQAQNAVRRRVLRPEVHRDVLDLRLGHQLFSPCFAFSSPGRNCCMPSHGLRKSKFRKSCVSFTGS